MNVHTVQAMAAQITGGGEHRVHIEADHGGGQAKAAAPERLLTGFVRSVALIERVGNSLGTLAFTWATVVLLGGYPTVLHPYDDFSFATAIVFLEATRMFSRNNRLDYQLFFNSRGAFRPLGWNGLVVVVFFTSVLVFMENYYYHYYLYGLGMPIVMAVPHVVGRFLCPGVGRLLICNPLRRAISLWSPLVVILFLVLSVFHQSKHSFDDYEVVLPISKVQKYQARVPKLQALVVVLSVVVFLLTISRLRFPKITILVARALGSKQVLWRRVILNLCMLAAGVMLVFIPPFGFLSIITGIFEVSAVAIVSLGNLQIPAAIVRVVLALIRLIPHDYCNDNDNYDMDNALCTNSTNPGTPTTNLTPSLNIFYGMVLGQGILYGVACILEFFSFILRLSLARRGGFRGQWGVECVRLYYAYAFEKYMEGDVLAPKKISLRRFAMESLNSHTPKMQLHGIRILHILLQRAPTRPRIVSELNASTKTMDSLIRLLGRTNPEDETIRLFAAKVSVEFAKSLRVVTVPGVIQVVSALLDYGNQQKRGNPLLDTYSEQEERHPVLNVADSEDGRQDAVHDTGNLLETKERSTQQVGISEQKTWIFKFWQQMLNWWSVPMEEPPTDLDILPALGMSILDNLASCDQDNCVEINRASGLIPKIIGFTSYRSDATYTEAQQKVLVLSSLKLLNRLTSVHGEIGITLRHKVSKHPFLLRNLVQILLRDSIMSSKELWKLVAGILRNLAVDGNARQAIGRDKVIIPKLMQAFLTPGPSSTDADWLLREVAGQALAMLAMDNINNCLVMLRETRYKFIKELTGMIHIDRYRCVAASLLRNICLHARPELKENDLKELSYILREVLERILRAEGAELEILTGLSSQISKAIPEEFARELELGHIKETFVKRLVDSLNANMEPSADYPGIRRMILEQAINMMEHDSNYASCFNKCRMEEALSTVEETASEAENYNIFLGDVGLMETREPLPSLVAKTKQLLAIR
ncbi:hypothetical protein ACP70R_004852 [Stipagrostis hirtigluma subsp. patula]